MTKKVENCEKNTTVQNQFSVSHDSSELTLICWFGAQEDFLIIIIIIINVKHSCGAKYFLWKPWKFQNPLINRRSVLTTHLHTTADTSILEIKFRTYSKM